MPEEHFAAAHLLSHLVREVLDVDVQNPVSGVFDHLQGIDTGQEQMAGIHAHPYITRIQQSIHLILS